MSYLGATLRKMLAEHDLKAADIARETGLLNSHLSRLIRGDQTFISKEDLEKILNCFARDRDGNPTPLHQAQIVAAHLMDERHGPGSELVKIEVRSAKDGKVRKPVVAVSPEAERAFEFIRTAILSNEQLEQMLINLASLMGMKPERTR